MTVLSANNTGSAGDCTSTFCLRPVQQNLLLLLLLLFWGLYWLFISASVIGIIFMLGKIPGKEGFWNEAASPSCICWIFNFFSNCYKEITADTDHVYWIPLLFHHSQAMWNLFYCVYCSCLLPCIFHVVFILLLEFAISTLQCCCLSSCITFRRTSQYLI